MSGTTADLAVLRVKDDSFFENLEPLEFGELPKVRSPCDLWLPCGRGGNFPTPARGVAHRIDESTPTSEPPTAAPFRPDAAINPGNSGGPSSRRHKVVGVAFQGLSGLENAGFFIPPRLSCTFLKDIEDGKYRDSAGGVRGWWDLQEPGLTAVISSCRTTISARGSTACCRGPVLSTFSTG